MPQVPTIEDYRTAIREHVCSRCPERPQGGPPCLPLGKRCGVEMHLEKLVAVVHANAAARIDPYIDALHLTICTDCPNSPTSQCPCPIEYLITLAVEAIESVDDSAARRN